MNIRKFGPPDREYVIALWERVFPDAQPHNKPTEVMEVKLAVDDMIFVVEKDSSIIGACMAGYDGHRGWLYSVAIDPNYRRRGIGKKLVNYAINSLRELGCRKINLQIRSGSNEVEDFYKSLGFHTEDRISMGARIDELCPE